MLNRKWFVVVACILLAGCGWHLRGSISASLNFNSISVDGAENDPGLHILLKDAFRRSGVTVVNGGAIPEVRLFLTRVKRKQRVLSVSSDGRVEEYALFYAVNVKAENSQGDVVLNTRPVEVTRDYKYDKNAALAKGSEEELLYAEMRDETAREILRRLQALSNE